MKNWLLLGAAGLLLYLLVKRGQAAPAAPGVASAIPNYQPYWGGVDANTSQALKNTTANVQQNAGNIASAVTSSIGLISGLWNSLGIGKSTGPNTTATTNGSGAGVPSGGSAPTQSLNPDDQGSGTLNNEIFNGSLDNWGTGADGWGGF